MNDEQLSFAELTPDQQKLFLKGMEQMAFLVAAGWQERRKEPSGTWAHQEMMGLIQTFVEEAQ